MTYKLSMCSNVEGEYRNCIDGFMQDCSISSALQMEILQSCDKSSIPYITRIACFSLQKDNYMAMAINNKN